MHAVMAEVLTTKRGGSKLVFNNFVYTKKKENDIHIFWYCVQRDSDNCKGAVKTLLTMEDPIVSHINNIYLNMIHEAVLCSATS